MLLAAAGLIAVAVPLVDDRTTVWDFRAALEEIRLWSTRTPGHIPIVVILERGWPLLSGIRGRTMFVLHENEEHRRRFTEGNPTLAGRAMFTCAPPGSPDAGVAILNDPVADGGMIRDLVRRGYLVRTRADADLAIDPARRRAALDAGAQIVSTDFPPTEPDPVTGYACALPDGATVRARPTD